MSIYNQYPHVYGTKKLHLPSIRASSSLCRHPHVPAGMVRDGGPTRMAMTCVEHEEKCVALEHNGHIWTYLKMHEDNTKRMLNHGWHSWVSYFRTKMHKPISESWRRISENQYEIPYTHVFMAISKAFSTVISSSINSNMRAFVQMISQD
jgi:hypothetical protein